MSNLGSRLTDAARAGAPPRAVRIQNYWRRRSAINAALWPVTQYVRNVMRNLKNLAGGDKWRNSVGLALQNAAPPRILPSSDRFAEHTSGTPVGRRP